MRKNLLSISLLLPAFFVAAQCDPVFDPPLSDRTASYTMDVWYDLEEKMVTATETIRWVNPSAEAVQEVSFYMYLNAFKNTNSTFLKGSGGNIFGEDVSNRPANTWGWITVDSIGQAGAGNLTKYQRYVQPNDGNPDDQTVLSVQLAQPVQPGDSLILHLKFTAKLPKTIVRSGYSKDDFALFVHWFPQLGVFEQNAAGEWAWNCHQFHRQTEFYADFGTYDVTIHADEKLVMGASGCLVSEQKNGNKTMTRRYRAEDVIDFAWVAYPFFEVYEYTWEGVAIRLLIPPEHCSLAPRYLAAMKHSLAYLSAHVGRYPYPQITVVDPPLHALRSGMMEYPTFITAGSFYRMPVGVRTMESLAAHEFSHQYFMGMLASNEKEEAWLDEGFATWFEDRIIDDQFGKERSLIDFLGLRIGNREQTRLEYTGMNNPKVGSTARPGWEINEGYKGLVYSKTATLLRTLQRLVGDETMDDIIKTYFERWKFRHPRGRDFIAVANDVVKRRHGNTFGESLDWLFYPVLFGTDVCDYSISGIENMPRYTGQGWFDEPGGASVFKKAERLEGFDATVTVHREGELLFAVEVAIYFEDGTVKTEQWQGAERTHYFSYQTPSRIVAAHVDPQQKIYLDLDLNNNSLTLQPKTSVLWKYTLKAVFWMQNVFQSVGFLF